MTLYSHTNHPVGGAVRFPSVSEVPHLLSECPRSEPRSLGPSSPIPCSAELPASRLLSHPLPSSEIETKTPNPDMIHPDTPAAPPS